MTVAVPASNTVETGSEISASSVFQVMTDSPSSTTAELLEDRVSREGARLFR